MVLSNNPESPLIVTQVGPSLNLNVSDQCQREAHQYLERLESMLRTNPMVLLKNTRIRVLRHGTKTGSHKHVVMIHAKNIKPGDRLYSNSITRTNNEAM
jgi:hypothetical protein